MKNSILIAAVGLCVASGHVSAADGESPVLLPAPAAEAPVAEVPVAEAPAAETPPAETVAAPAEPVVVEPAPIAAEPPAVAPDPAPVVVEPVVEPITEAPAVIAEPAPIAPAAVVAEPVAEVAPIVPEPAPAPAPEPAPAPVVDVPPVAIAPALAPAAPAPVAPAPVANDPPPAATLGTTPAVGHGGSANNAPQPERKPIFEDVSSVTRAYIDPDLIADPPNPLVIFGDGFWEAGEVNPGRFNPTLIAYGDLRTAVAFFENPDAGDASDVGTLQTKLTLELDLRLTASERVHARFEPLSSNGSNTRVDFDPENDEEFESSFKPATLYFEGALDSIISDFGGAAQHDTSDLNYALAVGKFPLELHNGYLISDIFTGLGVTKNNIHVPWSSNLGVGVVYAFHDVDANPAFGSDTDTFQLLTLHSFADLDYVHAEASLSWLGVQDEKDVVGGRDRQQYFAGLSLSWLRGLVGQGLHLFGQYGDEAVTDSGGLLVYESNCRLTPLHVDGGAYLISTFFLGSEHWTSLSGNLNQVGTTFQSDGLTGFPQQQTNGGDSTGGALALQIKTLRRRLHFIPEASYVDDRSGTDNDTTALGLRINYGFGRRSVVRMDVRQFLPDVGDNTNAGRVEYQIKF